MLCPSPHISTITLDDVIDWTVNKNASVLFWIQHTLLYMGIIMEEEVCFSGFFLLLAIVGFLL